MKTLVMVVGDEGVGGFGIVNGIDRERLLRFEFNLLYMYGTRSHPI